MSKSKGKPKATLHIVTDGTGNLADHILNAILTQFPGQLVDKQFHYVRNIEDTRTLAHCPKGPAPLCFHAVVATDIKHEVDTICEKRKIPHFDLTGSLVQFLAEHLQVPPINERASLHKVDDGYFRRIQAMEFTAQHDDARRIESAKDADIVILGLSRVSKSPTSTFLGSLGYKVANISIAREVGIPKEVTRIRARKVIALTMQPKRLFEIRNVRFQEFNRKIQGLKTAAELPYTNLRDVVREVAWAEGEYRRLGYPIIDTTAQTIEQTSAAILSAIKPKGPRFLG